MDASKEFGENVIMALLIADLFNVIGEYPWWANDMHDIVQAMANDINNQVWHYQHFISMIYGDKEREEQREEK